MPNRLRYMVTGIANREMGAVASARRVSSASLRGTCGSLECREDVSNEDFGGRRLDSAPDGYYLEARRCDWRGPELRGAGNRIAPWAPKNNPEGDRQIQTETRTCMGTSYTGTEPRKP